MPDKHVILATGRDREAAYLHRCREDWFDELGFTEIQSGLLADWAVDHHTAEDLLARGCPHELAFRLLRPLD